MGITNKINFIFLLHISFKFLTRTTSGQSKTTGSLVRTRWPMTLKTTILHLPKTGDQTWDERPTFDLWPYLICISLFGLGRCSLSSLCEFCPLYENLGRADLCLSVEKILDVSGIAEIKRCLNSKDFNTWHLFDLQLYKKDCKRKKLFTSILSILLSNIFW